MTIQEETELKEEVKRLSRLVEILTTELSAAEDFREFAREVRLSRIRWDDEEEMRLMRQP